MFWRQFQGCHDKKIGQIDGFDNAKFTFFDLKINDTEISIKINDFTYNQKLIDLPYVFGEGKIIFIAGYCRAGIKNIEIAEIQINFYAMNMINQIEIGGLK